MGWSALLASADEVFGHLDQQGDRAQPPHRGSLGNTSRGTPVCWPWGLQVRADGGNRQGIPTATQTGSGGRKLLLYIAGSSIIPVSCQPPYWPWDRNNCPLQGQAWEAMSQHGGVQSPGGGGRGGPSGRPCLHSALVPELPVSMQEASTTPRLWKESLEIRRFAGVDINSPKLPAQLLSQRCGPGGQGDSLSLGPNSPAWSGRPAISLCPSGPVPPPGPAACPGSTLSKRKLLQTRQNHPGRGLLWRDSRSQGAEGARVGRNTWGAGGGTEL